MRIAALLAVVAVAAVGLVGCATPYPYGALYTEIGAPAAVGDGGMSYSKVGVAESTSILGLVATGDASIKAAMANGGINKVKYVDYKAKNILGVYGTYTTTVYGD
jgi:hypothetical protein